MVKLRWIDLVRQPERRSGKSGQQEIELSNERNGSRLALIPASNVAAFDCGSGRIQLESGHHSVKFDLPDLSFQSRNLWSAFSKP
jgi:hypothetical protein